MIRVEPGIEQRAVDILRRQRETKRPRPIGGGNTGFRGHRGDHRRFAAHGERECDFSFSAELRTDDRLDLIGVHQLARQVDRFGIFTTGIVNHQLQLAGLATNVGVLLHKHIDGV